MQHLLPTLATLLYKEDAFSLLSLLPLLPLCSAVYISSTVCITVTARVFAEVFARVSTMYKGVRSGIRTCIRRGFRTCFAEVFVRVSSFAGYTEEEGGVCSQVQALVFVRQGRVLHLGASSCVR
jgi:hypothetical protein